MPLDILVGSQWGDEGKAKVVDYLSKEMDIIVRYQGGANAGHTVVLNKKKYVFHLIPSGILHPEKQCYIGNGVVLDPVEFINEIRMLDEAKIDYRSRLKISPLTHLIMPYHKTIDCLAESGSKKPIGTTGRGIGPCYSDKASRTGIRIADLFSEGFEARLKQVLEFKNFLLENYYKTAPMSFDEIFKQYVSFKDVLKPFIADVSCLVNDALEEGKVILAEGAQGAGLDIDFGTYPYVTSSNPIAGGAMTGIGVSPVKVRRIYAIAKAYLTRVGEGPFPTEQDNEIGSFLRETGGEFGSTTGRPRRCGWLDLEFLKFSQRVHGFTHIVLTKLDVLDGMETVKICVGYNKKGLQLAKFPCGYEDLYKVEPIYKEFKGWDKTHGVKEYGKLPENARKFIEFIESELKVPVCIISVGMDREDTIVR